MSVLLWVFLPPRVTEAPLLIRVGFVEFSFSHVFFLHFLILSFKFWNEIRLFCGGPARPPTEGWELSHLGVEID